jgi:hypothetical protein
MILHNPLTFTIGFDACGTLIGTAGVNDSLEKHAGTEAAEFSRIRQQKQPENSFRRGQMQNRRNFELCAAQALDFTGKLLDILLKRAGEGKMQHPLLVFPTVRECPRRTSACQ